MSKTVEEKRAAEKAWRLKNPEKVREYSRNYYKRNKEKEKQRATTWRKNNPEKYRQWVDKNRDKFRKATMKWLSKPENVEKQKAAEHRWRNSPAGKQYHKDWHYKKRLAVPEKRIRHLLNTARWRAPQRGLVFEIALYTTLVASIPTNCTCCGIALDYTIRKRNRNSRAPSLDRLDSTQGYTVKNTAITCVRCNFAKSDASLSELKMFVSYLEREFAARKH